MGGGDNRCGSGLVGVTSKKKLSYMLYSKLHLSFVMLLLCLGNAIIIQLL